eukprot:4852781-Prymnesium_polylepis.1
MEDELRDLRVAYQAAERDIERAEEENKRLAGRLARLEAENRALLARLADPEGEAVLTPQEPMLFDRTSATSAAARA